MFVRDVCLVDVLYWVSCLDFAITRLKMTQWRHCTRDGRHSLLAYDSFMWMFIIFFFVATH